MFLKKTLLITLLFFSFFLVQPTKAFSLSPTKYLVTVAPGGSQTIEITVENNESITENFILSVVTVEQDDNGRTLINNESTSPAVSWLRAEKNILEILPGSKETVKYTIDIPSGTEAGSHYLGLVVHPLQNNEMPIGLNGQLATILYLKVAGVVNESLNIFSWKSSKIIFDKNLKFFLNLKNEGNIEVPMQGEVIFRKYFGGEIMGEEITLGTLLLSGETRKVVYNTNLKNNFWPGLYHADLKIVYGQSQQIITGTYVFWYLPWWFLGIILLVVSGAIYFFFKKKFSDKK